MTSRNSSLWLLGLVLILLTFQANCDFSVDDIFTVVSTTSNSGNGTNPNCTGGYANCTSNNTNNQNSTNNTGGSNNTNNTNSTNGTNTTNITYCTQIHQKNCVINWDLIIQIITQQISQFSFFTDPITGQVIFCPPGCVLCTSATSCSVCLIGFNLSTSNSCVFCKGCQTCNPANPDICQTCFLPQVLIGTTCGIVVCTNVACQTCSNATNCLTCYQGYSLHNHDCVACIQGCNKCITNQTNCDPDGCGAGYVYFENPNTNVNECVACMAGCTSCTSDNTNNCIGCIDGYFATIDNTQTPAINQCTACLSNCKTCASSTTCQKCFKGFKLTSDKLRCVSKCNQTCNTCVQNHPHQCLTCYGGYTFNATSNTCDINITVCNGTGTCDGCPIKNVLISGYCQMCTVSDPYCDNCLASDLTACSSCLTGYYLSSTSSCLTCPTQCAVCLSKYACSSCQDGYYLNTQVGQTTGSCLKCDEPCGSCSQKAFVCTACPDGFSLVGSKCLGNINVQIQVIFNIIFSWWARYSNLFNIFIIGRCRRVNEHFHPGRLFQRHSRHGSTILSAAVSPSSTSEASAISSSIDSGITAGGSIGGAPVISSTTSVNGAPSSTSNLGLILGVSIPLCVLVIGILIFITVKLSKDQKYKEYEDVDKNSLSNKEQQINNV